MPSSVSRLRIAEPTGRIHKDGIEKCEDGVERQWAPGFSSGPDPLLYCITCPGSMRCPGCPSAQRSYSPLSDQSPPKH